MMSFLSFINEWSGMPRHPVSNSAGRLLDYCLRIGFFRLLESFANKELMM